MTDTELMHLCIVYFIGILLLYLFNDYKIVWKTDLLDRILRALQVSWSSMQMQYKCIEFKPINANPIKW